MWYLLLYIIIGIVFSLFDVMVAIYNRNTGYFDFEYKKCIGYFFETFFTWPMILFGMLLFLTVGIFFCSLFGVFWLIMNSVRTCLRKQVIKWDCFSLGKGFDCFQRYFTHDEDLRMENRIYNYELWN